MPAAALPFLLFAEFLTAPLQPWFPGRFLVLPPYFRFPDYFLALPPCFRFFGCFLTAPLQPWFPGRSAEGLRVLSSSWYP